ncbi:hypothetical protein BX661DRAFT_177904 [Kickxella alabastrina]|uniref:uncharacterized protein n=1 Tax=Kickxella alabastrina TaxID=61397 RepID=UPI002220A02B|nr:uncharacterized protein BX661DRAFT_177904 [Kickxella alabastrina]KAI7833975.1 hypothetical protein BX661DRAFT_177904 [Kickxella alabastrina]
MLNSWRAGNCNSFKLQMLCTSELSSNLKFNLRRLGNTIVSACLVFASLLQGNMLVTLLSTSVCNFWQHTCGVYCTSHILILSVVSWVNSVGFADSANVNG